MLEVALEWVILRFQVLMKRVHVLSFTSINPLLDRHMCSFFLLENISISHKTEYSFLKVHHFSMDFNTLETIESSALPCFKLGIIDVIELVVFVRSVGQYTYHIHNIY